MQIHKIQIANFSSFERTPILTISNGMNIVIGQNNSGKSAFLQAFRMPLANNSHRSKTVFQAYELPQPEVRLEFSYSGDELRRIFLKAGTVFVPTDIQHVSETASIMHNLLQQERLDFAAIATPTSFTFFNDPFKRSDGRYGAQLQFFNSNGVLTAGQIHGGTGDNAAYNKIIERHYQDDIFFFSSERYNVGRCAVDYTTRLLPNASNLPAVLGTLFGDRGDITSKLREHMREIFPSFGNVSVRPCPQNSTEAEILIWPESGMPRPELAFSLNSSGTGLAQVLSILTAALVLEQCVIVIDEINSFLHPAATKALLRILVSEYSRHQYIISTHASEVITFSDSKALFVVKKNGYNSHISSIDLNGKDAFRNIANLLGISMTDVFAAEKVLWVEGPTEEICFAYLAHELKLNRNRNTAILSVTTGDFIAKRRNRALIYEIYCKVTAASSPLVATIGFSFDSENMSDSDKTDMVRESKGMLHFLPRRLLECYLISSAAICAFINEKDLEKTRDVQASEISTLLTNLASKDKFAKDAKWGGKIGDIQWLKAVDAANLIDDCCREATNQRVTFNKKADSLFLLNHIFRNEKELIIELISYIEGLLEAEA